MEINMNQQCTIKLFERGIEAIQKYYRILGLELPKQYQVGDKYTAPLWEIMNIFGEYTYMGPKPPFETRIMISDENT